MAESYAELRALRVEIGFSIAEMAELQGLKKATYQGYETGRRKMPAGFINSIRDWQQQDLVFMSGVGERVDAQLVLDGFGGGIPSEFMGEMDL